MASHETRYRTDTLVVGINDLRPSNYENLQYLAVAPQTSGRGDKPYVPQEMSHTISHISRQATTMQNRRLRQHSKTNEISNAGNRNEIGVECHALLGKVNTRRAGK